MAAPRITSSDNPADYPTTQNLMADEVDAATAAAAAAQSAADTAQTTADAAADFGASTGLVIIETATGVWSADAPARDPGVNPIEFRGWSDPTDLTDGIDTPDNINDGDRWVELDAPA